MEINKFIISNRACMAGRVIINIIFLIGFGCASKVSNSQNFSSAKKIIGCSNFVVYWVSEDSKSYYQIYLDARKNNLISENSLDIAEGDIFFFYKRFESDIMSTICTDLRQAEPPQAISVKEATNGIVKVSLTDENLRLYREGIPYELRIELIDVKFDNESMFSIDLGNVNVGWLPG